MSLLSHQPRWLLLSLFLVLWSWSTGLRRDNGRSKALGLGADARLAVWGEKRQTGFPLCVQQCALQAAAAVGCGDGLNFLCACHSPQFMTSAANCMIANCTTTDQSNGQVELEAQCKVVGTSVSLPTSLPGSLTSITSGVPPISSSPTMSSAFPSSASASSSVSAASSVSSPSSASSPSPSPSPTSDSSLSPSPSPSPSSTATPQPTATSTATVTVTVTAPGASSVPTTTPAPPVSTRPPGVTVTTVTTTVSSSSTASGASGNGAAAVPGPGVSVFALLAAVYVVAVGTAWVL